MAGADPRLRNDRREWVCYALGAGFLAAAFGLVGLAIIGCDVPQNRAQYETLSFFFDGVPEPGSPPRPRGYYRRGLGVDVSERLAAASRPASGPAVAAATITPLVYHPPFKDTRQCSACHDPSKSYQAPDRDVCRKCHKRHYDQQWDDWTHGPVALGQCGLCHVAHSSKYAGLLTAPMPDLCLGCHDPARTMSRPYHATAGQQPCTACHDPHFAGNRALLLDSLAYQRRGAHARVLPSGHSGWNRDACMRCHTAEKSNLPVSDVDKVCLSCHTKVQQPTPGRKLHDAVAKGRCTSCHTAHKSSRPSLIRPVAEKNCLQAGCHDLAKIQTDKHPKIVRGDCVICHAGHSSPRAHLLRERPLAPVAAPVAAPATAPAPASAPAPVPAPRRSRP